MVWTARDRYAETSPPYGGRPTMKPPKTNLWIVLAAVGTATAIAVLDLWPAARIAPWHGLFVIPVVWIALWSAEDDVVPVTAVATFVSVLVILKGLVSHETSHTLPLADRLIVMAGIWLTVLLALLRKKARRTYKWINLAGRR